MKFLRENIFYVILVGGALALIGLLMAVSTSISGSVQVELDKRQVSADALAMLRKPVSKEMVSAKERQLKDMQDKAKALRDLSVKWNKEDFKVLMLPVDDGSVPAFPIKAKLYEEEALGARLTEVYVSEYDALINSLKPTDLLTEKDVQGQVALRKTEFSQALTPPPDPDKQALEDGRIMAMLKTARAGTVYVTKGESLSMVFRAYQAQATPQDVWAAQVNLWITRDIIQAINKTNEDAMKHLPDDQKNVINAAVKRLVKAEIDKEAFFGEAESLTQRVTGPMNDVYRYTFTVVMPTRYLLAFQENLMRQNYHTILNVDMSQTTDRDKCYYGPDPVMEVTIRGELILLSAWTRGTWDPEKKAWSEAFPPLMPVEVLKDMSQKAPSALRPEDSSRLAEYK